MPLCCHRPGNYRLWTGEEGPVPSRHRTDLSLITQLMEAREERQLMRMKHQPPKLDLLILDELGSPMGEGVPASHQLQPQIE